MLDNLSSQKIILKDHFYVGQTLPSNNQQLHYPYFQYYKAKKKTQRVQKSFEKGDQQKSNDLNFIKVNSLVMAKKGSFKVSYLEDFTLEFPKMDYTEQPQQEQQINKQNQRYSPVKDFVSHIPKIYGHKKILNSGMSQRSSQNDILSRMKTEGSYKNNDLSQSSKDAINALFYQNTVQANQPTSPSSSSQWGLLSQSINNIYSNFNTNQSKVSSPQNLQQAEYNLEKDHQADFQQVINRKKGRSLPPLKLKSNASPYIATDCTPNNLSFQVQPISLNQKKRYSYLFDTYNMVAVDKVIEPIQAPLLLEQDPDISTVEEIFNGNKMKKRIDKTSNNQIEQKKANQPFQKKNTQKNSKKANQQDIHSNKSVNQLSQIQEKSIQLSKYADIQIIPFKSYKFPSKMVNNKQPTLLK